MIREIYNYLTTKTSTEARAFGHLYESISLIEREKRCFKHWQTHRLNCQNFILAAAKKIKSHNRLLILGSGPLHEIPIKDLASQFQSIDLVDIVHLQETKKKYGSLKNIFFIESDITELEKNIHSSKKISNKVPNLFLDQQYDLVISANLLSQLSYHLRNYLEKQSKNKYSAPILDQFCNQVSLDHYTYITSFPNPVVLITDIETHLIDSNLQILEIQKPFINFPLPTCSSQWWWDLAPMPEVSKDYSIKMKVQAFHLNF